MTLEEAKIADQLLKEIIDVTETEKLPLKHIIDELTINVTNEIRNKYVSLLLSDGFLNKQHRGENRMIARMAPVFHASYSGVSFYKFKGGYTQMVEEKIEKKRREKNKYKFDIVKDIVLILLAIGTLLISYFTS